MPFADLDEAVAHIVRTGVPFELLGVGPRGGEIRVETPVGEGSAARSWFAEHPPVLLDGTAIDVVVVERRGRAWKRPPDEGSPSPPSHLPPSALLGSDVDDAARDATARGWLVRGYEREAWLTADRRLDRINLCYDDQRLVVDVHYG